MKNLKEGASGVEVKKLQERLKKLGFNPGIIDGNFGPATESAVMALQRSEGLLVDGIVGPRTQGKLGFTDDVTLPSVTSSVTVRNVSKMFPFTPIGNINTNLPHVLNALEADQLGDKPMILMALSTIRAETEGFVPISEGISRFNTSPDGHPFDLYDNRSDLGNQGPPDGDLYKGRGFIQLTGRFNYQKHGEGFGLGNQLIENPDIANDPGIAAKLLSSFLKNKEATIKEALIENDLRRARRLVNGGSHGLDRFRKAFEIGKQVL
jgi:putative chitinase